MNYTLLFAAGMLVGQSLLAQCSSNPSLATPYAQNNGQRGAMFDVQALNAITIDCFDANLYATTTARYEIYYKVGSFQGSENNAAAWTFIGGVDNLTSLGTNLPTPIPISVNLSMAAGDVFAFYVTNTVSGGVSYTNATTPFDPWASNSDLIIYEGVGKGYPFASTYTARAFNGTLHYTSATLLQNDLLHFTAQKQGNFNRLQWELLDAMGHIEVERSSDGLHFQTLAHLPINGQIAYEYLDKFPLKETYYRLKIVSPDAAIKLSPIQVVTQNAPASLRIFPNPCQQFLQIESAQATRFTLYNALGQALQQIDFQENSSKTLDLSTLPAGSYWLRDEQGQQAQMFIKQR